MVCLSAAYKTFMKKLNKYNACMEKKLLNDEGSADEELQVVSAATVVPYKSFLPFTRTNSYLHLVRVTAIVLKYLAKLYSRAKSRHETQDPDESSLLAVVSANLPITASDFTAAELLLVREHYREQSSQLYSNPLGHEILANELSRIVYDPAVMDYVTEQGLKWTFITPYSPWKGGFYERLVGSVKSCLMKVAHRHTLDLWLFETTIFEIEAILNTRPLFQITSTNPQNNEVLRPIDLINPQFRLGRLETTTPRRIETIRGSQKNLGKILDALAPGIPHGDS
ncbi:hypothetical protein OESDEN_09797 [Oesophagostomum dentatum]|uniref:Integrase catalytic domain-containing protein n=1 Tax=Oesophagostomum dentatum TaxID=61180 RepID=A0A0B1T2H7_OESDE|nr:hypothetical protein OESDEN_09797 [Oesophagostomum dentatum]